MGFSTEHTLEELLKLQLDLQDKYADQLPRSMSGLHCFIKIYVKGFKGAAELRSRIIVTKSTDEIRVLLEEFDAYKKANFSEYKA